MTANSDSPRSHTTTGGGQSARRRRRRGRRPTQGAPTTAREHQASSGSAGSSTGKGKEPCAPGAAEGGGKRGGSRRRRRRSHGVPENKTRQRPAPQQPSGDTPPSRDNRETSPGREAQARRGRRGGRRRRSTTAHPGPDTPTTTQRRGDTPPAAEAHRPQRSRSEQPERSEASPRPERTGERGGQRRTRRAPAKTRRAQTGRSRSGSTGSVKARAAASRRVKPRPQMRTSIETSAGGLVISGLDRAVTTGGQVDTSQLYVALIGRVDRRGRLLWSMPKGHVEAGESFTRTAEREVWEETGIHGQVLDSLGEIDYWFVSDGLRIHKTVHHFLLAFTGGELNDEDPEVTEVAWLRFDELLEVLAYADERKLARRAVLMIDEIALAYRPAEDPA